MAGKPKSAVTGRPDELEGLTDERLADIAADVATGADRVDAVISHVPVSSRTVARWLKRGKTAARKGEACKEADLWLAVACARARATAEAQKATHEGNPEWWLEKVRRRVKADETRAMAIRAGKGKGAAEIVIYSPENRR